MPDVTASFLTMEGAKIRGAAFIGDTGFGSDGNFALFSESGLNYIVPLKHNTSEVEHGINHTGERR
jgi:transposase